MNQSQQIVHCLSVAAPFRPVPHKSWHFQWNIIVSLQFRSSLEVHLPICSPGRSRCFVEPLGSLAGLAMMAANRRDSHSPSGLPGSAATGTGGHSEPRTGLLSTTDSLQAKSQGPHSSCFQYATAVTGCVTVFRAVSPQAEFSHIQHSPRTTFVLAYSHMETGPKSLCSWSFVLVLAFHL